MPVSSSPPASFLALGAALRLAVAALLSLLLWLAVLWALGPLG